MDVHSEAWGKEDNEGIKEPYKKREKKEKKTRGAALEREREK